MLIAITSWITRTVYQHVSKLRLFQKRHVKVLKNSSCHYAKFELVSEGFCKNYRYSYQLSDHILKKKHLWRT